MSQSAASAAESPPSPSPYDTPPGDNRPAAYFEGTVLIIRASAIGKCPIRLARIATGSLETFSSAVHRAFAQGHEYESIMKFRLREAGLPITHEQQIIEYPIIPGLVTIRGHWDGFCPDLYPRPLYGLNTLPGPTHSAIFEAKSSAKYDLFLELGRDAFPDYTLQTDTYCHWARQYYPTTGILFAFQAKDDLAALHCKYYPEPKNTLQSIQARCLSVLAHIHAINSGSPPICSQHAEELFSCPFTDSHDDSNPPAIIENDNLAIIAEDYIRIGKDISALEDDRKRLRGILEKALAVTLSTKARINDLYTIQTITTERTNHVAFFRDNPDAAEKLPDYKSSSSYLRIDGPKTKKPLPDTLKNLEDTSNVSAPAAH